MLNKKLSLAVFVFSFLLGIATNGFAAQTPQIPIAGKTLPKFVNSLPVLSAVGGSMQTIPGNQPLTIRMCEFKARILPSTFVPPAGSTYAGYTWVWGYLYDPSGSSTCEQLVEHYDSPDGSGILDTYLGPVILNNRGIPTEITWVNDLPTASTTNVLAWKYSTDQTLHWADPLNSEMNHCNHMSMAPGLGDECAQNYDGPVPAVTHLHGGIIPAELDGGPDAWFTSDGLNIGHAFYSMGWDGTTPQNYSTYRYPNVQEAAPIWFHDHALGITRLNVYAGMAGGYLINDPDLVLPQGLSAHGLSRGGNVGTDEVTVPIVIQDRMFDTNGQLFFPSDSAGGILWTPNPEHPYWVPEFVGDTILVNGKVWPHFNVEPKRYRFLFINGSNARTYEMNLIDPLKLSAAPNFWVITTEGAYLDAPVLAKKLTMMPGERYGVIIDFSGVLPGTQLVLKNTGKTPFPAGAAPQGATTAQIMQFSVGACTSGNCGAADLSYNPARGGLIRLPNAIVGGTAVNQQIVRLPGTPAGPAVNASTVQKTRALTLNEVMGMPQNVINPVTGLLTAYPGGPLEILVNNTKWAGERVTGVDSTGHYTMEPVPGSTAVSVGGVTTYHTETPQEGDTEVWEIVNLTADAHPIHLHLVQFQLMNRQAFNVNNYTAAYNAAFPGGGYDPMTKLPYPAGVFIPGFGPPLPYHNGAKLGGNPDTVPYLQGKPMPPDLNERGWKDTVIAYPGQVTRLAVRWAPTELPVQTTGNLGGLYFPFDPSGESQYGYVWHCHIIDHEDNEMMRPDMVQLNPAAPLPADRPLVKDLSY